MAPAAWEFLHSLPHDAFLWPYDIDGTSAHVRALEAAGVLTRREAVRLLQELKAMRDRPGLIEETDEDVHSAIERVLTERLGPLGAKVHAGRSRNDQVATALRLWAREALTTCSEAIAGTVSALLNRAEETVGILAPGYTHLQRAQPITLGHWLCAHAQALARDLQRIRTARTAADVSPLGAGALAGSTIVIDPRVAAEELGFTRTFANSLDAVSDRDFLLDGAYACAVALTHLSRLCEEIVLWSSSEFGFVVLPPAYATGSSMMPQKRNPDVAELARGKAGLAVGALTGLFVTLKSLPLAYDRDLQVDKEHVGGVFAATATTFRAVAGLVAEIDFDVDRITRAVSDDAMLATDVAEALVRRGVPFREAHERVAALVRSSIDAGRSLADGVREHPDLIEPLSVREAVALLDARGSVRRRTIAGGPSPSSVRAQIRRLRRAL
jgi:argininosuccinate lyase